MQEDHKEIDYCEVFLLFFVAGSNIASFLELAGVS